MQVLRSLNRCLAADIQALLASGRPVGVTVGNFDGMHLGHQQLFQTLNTELNTFAAEGRPVRVLFTFEPHPRRVLSGIKRSELLEHPSFWTIMPLRRKIEIAKAHGFDIFLALRFSKEFSKLSPEEFVKTYLVKALHARLVVVGQDWAFGRGRSGDTTRLQEFGAQYGFDVTVVGALVIDGERVSSGRIKLALEAGEIELARKLMGRVFELSGIVVHGARRGRELGFPTANVSIMGHVLPKDGVYATFLRVDEQRFPAITNIGVRPTFGGTGRFVETHILDGKNYDLYNKHVYVEIIARIRDEVRFSGLEALKTQITADIIEARRILGRET